MAITCTALNYDSFVLNRPFFCYSLMYGVEDPSIAGMILDSPFSDLVDLMMELVDTYKFRLPKFTVKFAIQFMRRAIQKKAKFDIMELNTIKVGPLPVCPFYLLECINGLIYTNSIIIAFHNHPASW
jgi:hypothetical protein